VNESLRASLAGVARKLRICLAHFERASNFFSRSFFFFFFPPPQVFLFWVLGLVVRLLQLSHRLQSFPRPSFLLASDFVGSLFYDSIDSKLLIICCRKKNQIGCCENLGKIVVCLSCPCVGVCVFWSFPFPTILCLLFVFLSDLRVRCSGSLRLF
jgi:hypothetical protein